MHSSHHSPTNIRKNKDEGAESSIIITNDNFPCFVKNGEHSENLAQASDLKTKYKMLARNGLRYLTYGLPFNESQLLSWTTFETLFIKRNKLLFEVLREEMQNIFLNAFAKITSEHFDPEAENRLEIFINNFLSAYPFMDPEDNETVLIPQKIGNHWQLVKYQFKKIDISPQTGLLAKLIEDEDRLYAYGLSPITDKDALTSSPINNQGAQPYLLFEGTTYPSGQGADLNWLYNFKPGESVGEGHDMTHVREWVNKHNNIKVVGHSKGGTMAMIAAATFPDKISEADCLNPTALCSETLGRLIPGWNKLPSNIKLNVYTHVSDPVFLLENNFLPGTNIYRFGKLTDQVPALVAHVHYFAGHKSTVMTKVDNLQQEIPSKRREIMTNFKKAFNWILFPLMYIKFTYQLCARKTKRFFEKHSTAFKLSLFFATIGACAALAATGVLAPLIAPIAAATSPILAYGAVTLASLAVGAISAVAVPKVANLTENVISKSSFTTASLIALSVGLTIGSIISFFKVTFKSLFGGGLKPLHGDKNEPAFNKTVPQNESTKNLLRSLKRNQSEPILTEITKPVIFKRSDSESNLATHTIIGKSRSLKTGMEQDEELERASFSLDLKNTPKKSR